jgi:hypothetical protein
LNQKQQQNQMRNRAQSLGSAIVFNNRQRSSNSESANGVSALGADGAPLANGKKTCSKGQILEDDFYSKQVNQALFYVFRYHSVWIFGNNFGLKTWGEGAVPFILGSVGLHQQGLQLLRRFF